MTTDYTPKTFEIPLTQGQVTIVDEIDYEYVSQFKWSSAYMPKGDVYYSVRYVTHQEIKGRAKRIWMHHDIFKRIIGGTIPKGFLIDHIDGNSLNNRRSNLRLATRQENNRNRKKSKNNTSGYKGVCFDKYKKKWVATIGVDGKVIWLGRFKTPELAYEAYCEAAIKYHGEFARLE